MPSYRPKMQFLMKIVKDCESRSICRTQQNIKIWLFVQKVNGFQLSAVHYFCKKHHPRCSKYILNTEYCSEYVSESVNYFHREFHFRCLTGFWIRLWHKVVFLLGGNCESNYVKWRLLTGGLEKSCFGTLILSQIHIGNIVKQGKEEPLKNLG